MDRIYTGFESLDKHLKIYKGDLVVIGGRPAIGKTCFMCSMIEKTIDKQKTLFFTMQTNKHKAIERLQLLNVKENDNFYLYDDFVDYEELLLIVAEHKIKYDIDVVFVDNAVDFFNNTCCSESETTIKLKRIAEKLNVAIIIADSHGFSGKKYSYYLDLRHKSLIKYADKIITINRPDKMATEKEFIDGLVEKYVAEIMIDKDMEEYFSPWINLKFDNNSLTFNEIPKTP
jgi:KaiC/GvpD/RAD55 family RecA-like ATPase